MPWPSLEEESILRAVTSRRVLQQECTDHGHDQENATRDLECGVDAVMGMSTNCRKRSEQG